MSSSSSLKSHINRWKLALFAIVVVYGILLTVNLPTMPIHWDEVNHLTGGLHLIRGEIVEYFLTSSFYPPMFNLVATGFFALGGASVFAARLVAVAFALLSIVAVFELADRLYGSKTALISAVLFAVMPGIVWLSRIALIETMLIFVFTASMLYFFKWLTTKRERDFTLSTAVFAIGIAVKYQMLVVAPLTIIVSMLIFRKDAYLKNKLARQFKRPRVIIVSVAAAIAMLALYELYGAGLLGIMWQAISMGTAEKTVYSVRFPIPVFYLVEMVWPNGENHPISFLLYLMGLTGLGMFAYQRKTSDKFLLTWFAVIYVVFTVIPNREWRYVVLLFPVLAISAASLITSTYDRGRVTWQLITNSRAKKNLAKLAAAVLVIFVGVAIFFSCFDAYNWMASDQKPVPVEQAATYVCTHLSTNGSVVVACPLNLIYDEMVWFCMNKKAPLPNKVWQYPDLAVDAYTPSFNSTMFVNLCQQHNTKYVLLYEYGSTTQYFNTTLTPNDVYRMLNETGRFMLQASFGSVPNRIFVLSFS